MATLQPQTLPINNLQANPLQPRGKITKDQLDELVESVHQYGILEPLIVAHTPAGYQIIAGERRWRAAKLAGLTEVPVIVKETSPKGMLEMAIIENVQRVDLSPIERAQAFQQLIRDFKFTTTQVAQKVSKSMPYVSNSLRLLTLPDAIKDGLAGGQISEGHARALSGIEDERKMIECYKMVLKENASVRRTEDLVRRIKARADDEVSPFGGNRIQRNRMEVFEKELQGAFNEDAKVQVMRTLRQTKVVLVFKGSPEQTERELQKVMKLTKYK